MKTTYIIWVGKGDQRKGYCAETFSEAQHLLEFYRSQGHTDVQMDTVS